MVGCEIGRSQSAGRLLCVSAPDLAPVVEREHHRMGPPVHVEADHILHSHDKGWIVRAFRGAGSVRLDFVGLPDSLHRVQRNACRLGCGGPFSMGKLTRWFGAGKSQHLCGSGGGRLQVAVLSL